MNKTFAYSVGFLLLAALLLFSMTYTVRFNEVAVRTTFGKTSTASVKSEPGIHFRFPLFADRVTTYDTRVQLAEPPHVEGRTADGQSVAIRGLRRGEMARLGDGVGPVNPGGRRPVLAARAGAGKDRGWNQHGVIPKVLSNDP